MKAKRILAALLAAIMVLGALTACGSKTNTDGTTVGSQTESKAPEGSENVQDQTDAPEADYSAYMVTEPIEVEFWYNGSSNEAFYNEIVEEFNASQEYITVVPVCAGAYAAIREQIIGAQAAGTGLPALCAINAPALPAYVETGVAECLTNYIAAYDVDLEDYVKGFMNQAEFGGEYYALPHGPSAAIYYYNKTALDAVGLGEFPATWEEFRQWVKDVYEATGKPAMTFNANDGNVIYNMTVNFGGILVNEDNLTTGVDNDVIKGHYKEIKELVDAGYIEWNLEGASAIQNKFLLGDTMSMTSSCTEYDTFINDDFEVGMAWNWSAEKGVSTVGGAYLFIPAENDQQVKNAGFVFLAWLTSADVNLRWANFSSYITTHYSTIQDSEKMALIYDDLPLMTVVYDNIDKIEEKVKNRYYESVTKTYYTYINQIILENADFDSSWSAMVDEINYTLAGN